MDTITVRRWVAAPPAAVWRRLLDLERLGRHEEVLDLEDIVGEHADECLHDAGTVATVTRRSGTRVDHVTVAHPASRRCGDRSDPDQVTLALLADGERWLLTIDVTPISLVAGGGSDVRLHAERDPGAPRRLGPRHLMIARSHRAAHQLGVLLDGVARQLDTVAAAPEPGEGAAPQRMVAGR